ncbi:expressed unknown protein [Seminavis robusta]|uniref:Uncharacterized protein n=1 Tax=Seminavis robusta TaxID=568900 RepID=A0A9N8HTG1_9STRA|nr:expressed unknown protein [Seminavis robusta]|eukprot:Sro1657_g289060.1 n/a (271) ;mRNA; f:506-1318
MAAGHGPNMAVPPAVGAYVSNNPNNAPSVQGQPNSWTAAALQNQSSAGAPPVRAGAALQPQQAQPQQLHQPQQAPGLMGFLESQVATLYQQLQQHPQQGPPSMPQVLPQQQQPQQQQPQQQQPQRFLQSSTGAGMPAQNAVVVAVSGAGTNTLNQSTLNQSIAASNLAATIMAGTHASIPQPQQQPAPANSGTTTNGSNDDLRLRLALHFFEEQVRGVYQNAMQSAGYSMEEIQATSPAYQRFVQRATQAELERLQSLNDMKPPSSHKKE